MNWLKDLIENRLDDNARVILFGLGDGAVERVKERITSEYRGLGGSENYTERDLDEKLKDIQRGMLPQLGSSFAVFTSTMKLADEFKFSTVPGIQTAAATIDGYGAVIGNILQKKEELLFGYGMTAKNIFQGGVIAATMVRPVIRALWQIPSYIKVLRNAKGILSGIVAARNLATVGAAAPNPLSPINIAAAAALWAVTEFGGRAAAEAAQMAFEDYATAQAIRASAHELLVPERLTGEFENYRSTFLRHHPEDVYAIMESMLTTEFMGVSADMFGYDYNRASGITKKMSLTGFMNESQQGEYAMRAMQLDSMFGTGSMFEGTMADMSRITRGEEVDKATELFQEFFSSLVVDGRLHLSQLALVGELSGFTESYVMGAKYNLGDGASNLARTHQFLNPMFGNRQTTAVTQQVVTGMDSVLLQGVVRENQHVENIMGRTGITASDALGGITSSPEMLERFLYGMYLQLGIGHDSFDENGDLSDDDMGRFIAYSESGLNMDRSTSRGVYVAYREYVGGARGEEVSTAYAESVMNEAGEDLDLVGLIDLTKNWTRGSRVLSEITFSYADILIEMNTAVANMSRSVMPSAMPNIVGNINRADTVLNEGYSTPLRRVFDSVREFFLPTSDPSSGGRPATSSTGTPPVSAVEALSTAAGAGVEGLAMSADEADRFTLLYNSLIQQESGGVHTTAEGALLESSAGARGISQVMRATGENPGYGVSPLKDQSVEEYLRFGEDYLSAMLREYGNDEAKALAAYNWGPGNLNWAIANYGDNWLDYAPQETKDYVRKVLGRLQSVGGSVGGFAPSRSRSFSMGSSQIVSEYVNIDVELNGRDSSEFARYFENSFMRA